VLTTTTTTASFTAGGSPVVVDSGITVADPDNPTLQYATVTLGGYISTEDELDYATLSGITVTHSGGVYTLTGNNASPGDFTTELESLAYRDTNTTDPNTTPRSLAIFVYDGQKNATATYTIDVIVPTPPTISAPGAQNVDEDQSFTFPTSGAGTITVTDPDIGSGIDSMSLGVNHGALYLGSTDALVTDLGDGTDNVDISGTLAALDAALAGMTYYPTAGYLGADPINFSITDSAASQNDSGSITLSAVLPPAPTLSPGFEQIVLPSAGAQTVAN